MKTEVTVIAGKPVKAMSLPALRAGRGNWRNAVATFLDESEVREGSRELYKKQLAYFFMWTEKTGRNLAELALSDVNQYKAYLSEGKHLSSLTVASYIVPVRRFYSWIEASGLGRDIAKGVKVQKKQNLLKSHLSDNKSAELLAYFESKSLRDFALVNLILRTGLRTIEASRININDIAFITIGDESQRVLHIWGKGRTEGDKDEDFVIVSDKAYLPIKNYIAMCRKGAKTGEPLFVSTSNNSKGQALSTRTISGICKEGFRAIGIDDPKFSAHSLRHTTACSMLNHGASLTEVQTVLRHVSVDTTRIYSKSIEAELRLRKPSEFLLDSAF